MSSKWMSAEFTKSHKHVQENDEFAVTLYKVRVFIEVTFCLMWFHYSTTFSEHWSGSSFACSTVASALACLALCKHKEHHEAPEQILNE